MMVGTLYDHMTALVITGMIFVSTVVVVPTLSYVNPHENRPGLCAGG